MEAHHRSVVFEGKTIDFTLEQKEVKNLNLRVHKDGNVFVSADPLVPLEEVDAFVCRKGAFILSAQRDFSRMALYMPRPKRYIRVFCLSRSWASIKGRDGKDKWGHF